MKQPNINTAEYWNNVYQQEWESGLARSEKYKRDYGPIHDEVIGLIPAGSRVLDIACGPGLLCRKIKERVPSTEVLGIDFSQYTVAQNQARDHSLGVEYRCVDIRTDLVLIKEQFDVVTM